MYQFLQSYGAILIVLGLVAFMIWRMRGSQGGHGGMGGGCCGGHDHSDSTHQHEPESEIDSYSEK